MRRRNFIGGVLSSIALIGTSIKAKSDEVKVIRTDEEDFYEFFHKFNGFPISEDQKMFYDWYNKDYKKMTMGRQTGTTTFSITLAAYKSLKNETVSYFTFSEYHRKYCVGIYKRNMINFREKFPRKVWTQMEPFFLIHSDGIRGKNPSISLFDNWSYTRYPHTIFNYLKGRDTKVFWMDTKEYNTI
jgi:hypothetical protein